MTHEPITLSVIMKNEAKVLPRMLNSVWPLIDYYCVIDTGSTDNSKEIVKDFFYDKNIPGEVHDHPFVDFEDARNFAISKIKNLGGFSFWIDCDEELMFPNSYNILKLKKKLLDYDKASMQIIYGNSKYGRDCLFRINKPFRFTGKVHEVLVCDEETRNYSVPELSIMVHPDGNSWQPENSKEKYLTHAQILEKEVMEKNIPRDVFYLAQSYRDAGEWENAIKYYLKRSVMNNGFFEEKYYSLLMIANLYSSHYTPEWSIWKYFEAHQEDSLRGEHILNLIIEFQNAGFWEIAYIFSKYAVEKYHNKNPYPQRVLFIDEGTYSHKIMDCHILNCRKLNKLEEINILMPKKTLDDLFNSIPSAWTGHRDFAKWLVEFMDPVVIIDLGVDYGYSTFCFAEGNKGIVFGVDSFEGDQHTGFRNTYDELMENIKWVKKYHSIDNIEIIKSSFDEVAKNISIISVDILHIDGLHTYEAVKHDYETWSPKLSENSVVLFHDIESFEGVKKFWNELPGHKYEFKHSAGLGVLAKDEKIIQAIKEKYDAK